MTEEEVMIVGGGEISDSDDCDQIRIKGEHRNGVTHEDGSVGGAISGEVTAASGDDSDLVIIENAEGDGLGQSDVAVSECAEAEFGFEAVKENDCEGKMEISNGTISVGGDDQNDGASVVVLDGSVDKKEANVAKEIHDRELQVQNGSENGIRDGAEAVNVVVDANGMHHNGEVCGDVSSVPEDKKDDLAVVKGNHADGNGSNSESESVAVEDSVVNKETEVLDAVDGVTTTADVKECADEDGQSNLVENTPQIESGDSGGGHDIEKEWENVAVGTWESVSNAVSDEEVVNGEHEVDCKLGSVINGDVQNGLADSELNECAKKDEIPVGVDEVTAATDVKECEMEDTHIRSDVEKPKFETVSDSDVDRSIVSAEYTDVQNCFAELEVTNQILSKSEMGCRQENLEEETGQVPKVEDSLALNSTNDPGDVDIVSDMNGNSSKVDMESIAEPSNMAAERETEASEIAAKSEAETSNIAVESEAEPLNNVVENEVQPSNIATEREAEPSVRENEGQPSNIAESEAEPSKIEVNSEAEPGNIAMENEAEPSNIVVESEAEPEAEASHIVVENEAEPSTIVVENEVETSNIAVEKEAEPSTIVVENDAEPSSIDAEPSAETELAVECEVASGEGEMKKPTQDRSNADALDGQNMGSKVVKKPFYYLIKLPRYDDDENIKEQIRMAMLLVDEKTKIRDAVRAESQTLKASCKEYSQEFRALISAERAARDLLKSKRQEMDSVQSTMNRLNNAISVGDIDSKIRNMEHMIEHETLPLKEEKQLIRQIKQLKQNREELSSSMAKQDQSLQSLDQKDGIEESMKQLQLLKKEMELLRGNVLKAEAATKASKKKYDDECTKLNEMSARFKVADDIRQEAYAKLLTSRKKLHEKNKYFWEYKNASKKAQDLATEGKKEELQCFCVDQVERIMELWNKSDEFRKDYVRCNTRSTLRRLQTLDGRSLGPYEEPPVIPPSAFERASRNNSSISHSAPQQEEKPVSIESVNTKAEPLSKVVVQKTEKNQTTKAKKPTKSAQVVKPVAPVSCWADEPEDTPEEPVRTKEEEERILKAEKARKEEEEAKLKEKRRLEEIEKAKEAMLRKKRYAEKAQQRAALKAQREAEQKEKEREKKARKKEKRKAASAETAENTEQEPAPVLETVTRSIEENDQSEKPAEVTKRPPKPSQFTRQTKLTKSIPLPLRNRGKRRIQPWMWALIAVMVAVALFYLGNNSSLRFWLQGSSYRVSTLPK